MIHLAKLVLGYTSLIAIGFWSSHSALAIEWAVTKEADRIEVRADRSRLAHYVFNDARIFRPYFANVRTLDGRQVTRRHPPQEPADATDHAEMHPGIWLGLGDLNGVDFWRNQGRMVHRRFVVEPKVHDETLEFATESELVSPDGGSVGALLSHYSFAAAPGGWLLVWDATFEARTGALTFGDQEEMGLGVRMATPLTEKNGGMVRNTRGLSTAAATWGQPAEWSDYSGTVDGRRAGVTLMAHPSSFRANWWHNRDYGLMVANPFGRAAMKQGELSSVTIESGKSLRLVWAVCVHDGEENRPVMAYQQFLQQVRIKR